MLRLLLLCASLPLIASDSSKTEAELRRQLAVSEAARARSDAALKAGLASSSKANVQATEAASRGAADDAFNAQLDAAHTASVIEQAAIVAKTQADSQQRITLITATGMIIAQLLVFMGIIAGFVHNSLIVSRNHKWAMEKAEKAEAVIQKLETNTNSIKDALVASTAKENFARGMLEGKEAAEAKA